MVVWNLGKNLLGGLVGVDCYVRKIIYVICFGFSVVYIKGVFKW